MDCAEKMKSGSYDKVGVEDDVEDQQAVEPLASLLWLKVTGVVWVTLFLGVFILANDTVVVQEKSEIETNKISALHKTLLENNFQNRRQRKLGLASEGFVRLNEVRKNRRRQNMVDLDSVRVDYCGNVEDSPKSKSKSKSLNKWKLMPDKLEFIYTPNSTTYAQLIAMAQRDPEKLQTKLFAAKSQTERRICEHKHPRLEHVNVRVGK